MPRYHCSLQDLIPNLAMTDIYILELSNQILQGLHYLHSNSIAHRDLKSPNILATLNENGSVKLLHLADFGTAIKKEYEETLSSNTIVGSPATMAPEVLANLFESKKESYDVQKADSKNMLDLFQ